MAVLRQRHSCRERQRFVRSVPELCLLQGVYPDEAQVCSAGLPASSHPAKRVFLVRVIAGEDRVPPGDQVSDRERAPVPDVSGSEGRGYGCWPALSVRQDHHRSRRAWRVRRFTRQPVSACVAREAGYGQLRQ